MRISKDNKAWGLFVKDRNQKVFYFHSAHWSREIAKSIKRDVIADEAIIKRIKVDLIA